MRPGRMHRIAPMAVPMPISIAVRNTAPRLRGLKNVPMLTGFPSAMSRQPDTNAACM